MSDCDFIRNELGKYFICCDSCHEDQREFGSEYDIELTAPWDYYGQHILKVCCQCPDLTKEDWIVIYTLKDWNIKYKL